MSTNKYCNGELLERLSNLKLLKLVNVSHIQGIFKSSFNELRCISWRGCLWTHLPYSVHMQNLVFLDMSFSRLETLWNIAQVWNQIYLLFLFSAHVLYIVALYVLTWHTLTFFIYDKLTKQHLFYLRKCPKYYNLELNCSKYQIENNMSWISY